MLKAATLLLSVVPLVVLAWRWQHRQLGFNPIEAVQRFTGDWTLWFLVATLSIAPLRRIPGLSKLITIRRMLGLFTFFYGSLHFLHYLWIDKLWDWADIASDFIYRRFYIAGLVAWSLMVPLAATSFNGAVRWMGGKRWQWLHRLVYLAAIAGVVHYLWQGKAANLEPLLYCAVLALLLLYRVGHALLKARPPHGRPRS